MKSLSDLYQKRGAVAAPSATSPAVPSADEKAPPPSSGAAAPILETPPGLPQEYIDANLKNQPLPPTMEATMVEAEQERPLNVRIVPNGESMCNATSIPYTPGYESSVVKSRIAQGPHVFTSRAEKERFEKGLDEKSQEQVEAKGPILAHPDTLRPGTFIKGESPAYRPG